MTINAPIAKVNGAAVRARIEREAAAYRAHMANAVMPPEVIDTEYRGIPAKMIEGATHVAISTNCRRNGAEWAILRNGDDLHADKVLCYLKRREVATWLIRQAA